MKAVDRMIAVIMTVDGAGMIVAGWSLAGVPQGVASWAMCVIAHAFASALVVSAIVLWRLEL